MGYAHIENLYRPEAQDILLFRECFALEKIHGTSAHVRWHGATKTLSFFSGGEKHESFVKLFNPEALAAAFLANARTPEADIIVYGEAYGGKQQGMSKVYGPRLRFVAFDVQIGEHCFLDVPDAAVLVGSLGLEFVAYSRVSTDLAALDAERDAPSVQAHRNSEADGTMYDISKREGIVLRPLIEVRKNNGARICAKHKRAEFAERKTPPPVDPSALQVLKDAEAIATEWATHMRLLHVLDKLGNPTTFEAIPSVIAAMWEDVAREASGEIVESKAARKAVGAATVKLYKALITRVEKTTPS